MVVSLVQLGMDTHDMVDDIGERRGAGNALRARLLVLAGNYYSSRFYHLLSQAGQIEMVRRISNARVRSQPAEDQPLHAMKQ